MKNWTENVLDNNGQESSEDESEKEEKYLMRRKRKNQQHEEEQQKIDQKRFEFIKLENLEKKREMMKQGKEEKINEQ